MKPIFAQFAGPRRRGLTLMEMIVAVSILIVIILAVGLIFSSASKAVGVSQKTLDVLSNVRAIQWQLERDLAGLDKNSFMVIRSGVFNDGGPNGGTDRRCDLLTFFSHGTFPHRTGAHTNNSFTDSVPSASHAMITWGQLVLQSPNSSWAGTATDVRNARLDMPANQDRRVPLNQVPTGIKQNPDGSLNAADMTLGRSAMLLFPKNAALNVNIHTTTSMGAFQNDFNATSPMLAIDRNLDYTRFVDLLQPEKSKDGSVKSHISQSRVDVATVTASQIATFFMVHVLPYRPTEPYPRYEADRFCFRRATLRSPHDDPSHVVTGYFRMHPIAMQGVSSFAIDWTDGKSVYAAGDRDVITGDQITNNDLRIGTTKWYGLNPSSSPVSTAKNPGSTLDGPQSGVGSTNGDSYCAIFSYDTPRSDWPVALRFRYHVEDPSGRLKGGRGFVQIVKLQNH
ncbi:MAG: type II secretion system GspH family protein [Phycisphaerales bacterium]|nr:type II secretion system GspH family protein [Phycisphaerales bacterium]